MLYSGKVMETAPAAEFFALPRHPYSGALLAGNALVGPFTVENGLLTPTQKIRRMLVIRANAEVLSQLHG